MNKHDQALERFQLYSKLFETPEGKAFLEDFLTLCGVFSSSYVAGDTSQTDFNEGKRAAGLFILNIVNQSPAVLARITQQRVEQERLQQYNQVENTLYN